MNEIDHTLRTCLAEHAQDVPPAIGLLDAVQGKVRKRRQHRVAVAAIVAVLLLAAGTALSWTHQRDDRLVPTNPPTPTGLGAPASPLSIGWLPAGFGKPTLSLSAIGQWTFRATRAKPQASVVVLVSATPLEHRASTGKLSSTTVDGYPATLYKVPRHVPNAAPYGTAWPEAVGPFTELTGQRGPHTWVQVDVFNNAGNVDLGVSDADVGKIAESLRDRPAAVPDLLRFASIPDGLAFGSVWTGFGGKAIEVQLVPTSTPPSTTTAPDGLHTVDYGAARIIAGADTRGRSWSGRKTLAHGRTGNGPLVTVYSSQVPHWKVAMMTVAKGRVIVVDAADSLGWSNQELIRYTEGIQIGRDFRCCGY